MILLIISIDGVWGKALDMLGFVLGFAVIPANVALKGLM